MENGFMEEKEAEVKLTVIRTSDPILKRVAAFLIDAVAAFIPALAMYIIFTGGYTGWTPIWYESPVIAAVTMIDLPPQVNESLNTFDNGDGSTHTEYNVSFSATVCRVISVLSIVFYVFYSTFCAYIFDGQTIGKKLMGLRILIRGQTDMPEEEEEQTKWKKKNNKCIFLREVLGKVLLNSVPVFPILSFFIMLFTKNRLTLHDMIGGTCVMEEKLATE